MCIHVSTFFILSCATELQFLCSQVKSSFPRKVKIQSDKVCFFEHVVPFYVFEGMNFL